MQILIEAAVESRDAALAAVEGGADRLELCTDLADGGTTPDLNLDPTRDLIAAARPLPVTFHRAFDVFPDRSEALEQLISLDVERVLTSGGAPTAPEGADEIRKLVVQANGRIEILPGGGITPNNVARLVQRTGVREVHFSVKDAEKVRGVMRALK